MNILQFKYRSYVSLLKSVAMFSISCSIVELPMSLNKYSSYSLEELPRSYSEIRTMEKTLPCFRAGEKNTCNGHSQGWSKRNVCRSSMSKDTGGLPSWECRQINKDNHNDGSDGVLINADSSINEQRGRDKDWTHSSKLPVTISETNPWDAAIERSNTCGDQSNKWPDRDTSKASRCENSGWPSWNTSLENNDVDKRWTRRATDSSDKRDRSRVQKQSRDVWSRISGLDTSNLERERSRSRSRERDYIKNRHRSPSNGCRQPSSLVEKENVSKRTSKQCRYFAAGRCSKGSNCWFSHDADGSSSFSNNENISGWGEAMKTRDELSNLSEGGQKATTGWGSWKDVRNDGENKVADGSSSFSKNENISGWGEAMKTRDELSGLSEGGQKATTGWGSWKDFPTDGKTKVANGSSSSSKNENISGWGADMKTRDELSGLSEGQKATTRWSSWKDSLNDGTTSVCDSMNKMKASNTGHADGSTSFSKNANISGWGEAMKIRDGPSGLSEGQKATTGWGSGDDGTTNDMDCHDLVDTEKTSHSHPAHSKNPTNGFDIILNGFIKDKLSVMVNQVQVEYAEAVTMLQRWASHNSVTTEQAARVSKLEGFMNLISDHGRGIFPGYTSRAPLNFLGTQAVCEAGGSNQDKQSVELFKKALVELVEEILNPVRMDGLISRKVQNTVVKKVVEKIITVEGVNIPKIQEHIDQYLSSSKPRISTLINEYVAFVRKKPASS